MNSQGSGDVFLLHRSTDKDFVRALADQIEKYQFRGRPLTTRSMRQSSGQVRA
jgi:hypothetical protein